MFRALPRSVIAIAGFHLVAALVFGVTAHVDASFQFPELVSNDDADFAVSLYANRNIGIGLALVAALGLRSPLAIAGLMVARFVTDLADLVVAFTGGPETGQVVGSIVFFSLLLGSEAYVIRTVLLSERSSGEVSQ